MTAMDRWYSASAFMDNTYWSTPDGNWWSAKVSSQEMRFDAAHVAATLQTVSAVRRALAG
jgi:hypothetical protein